MRLLISLVFLLFTSLAQAEEITGYVVNVTDGDTLTILSNDGIKTKIRLAEIDAPELRTKQDYAITSRNDLYVMTYAKYAVVEVKDIDRYGRVVGRITCDGYDVNKEMVRRGSAWIYRQYSSDKSLIPLEEKAKKEKRGLWSRPAMAPWEWRRSKK